MTNFNILIIDFKISKKYQLNQSDNDDFTSNLSNKLEFHIQSYFSVDDVLNKKINLKIEKYIIDEKETEKIKNDDNFSFIKNKFLIIIFNISNLNFVSYNTIDFKNNLISNENNEKENIKNQFKNSGQSENTNFFDYQNKNIEKEITVIIDKLSSFLNKENIPVVIVGKKNQLNFINDLILNLPKNSDFVIKENINLELGFRIGLIIKKLNLLSLNNFIEVKDLIIDLDRYEVKINNEKIELTFKEYELLKLLLENQDKVFTRKKLLSIIWEYDFYGGSRTVDVHIRRLRSKIKPPYCDMIKTIRNVGYMFSVK